MVVGPAWTRGEIEKPQGEKNMGTWTAGVYTAEQQARLGVDEAGNKVTAPDQTTLSAAQAIQHYRGHPAHYYCDGHYYGDGHYHGAYGAYGAYGAGGAYGAYGA